MTDLQAYLEGDVSNNLVVVELQYSIDYNNSARVVVATALGQIPTVGFALGALVNIFWPSSERDVWSEIEAKVEALIDKKIAENVWRQVSDDLIGLNNVLDEYLYAAQNLPDDPKVVSEKWNVAQGHFLHDLPHFQSKGYELLLLPLFAQFANLHLSLLRDGAQFGSTWGWSRDLVDRVKDQLTGAIADYIQYTDSVYAAGLEETKRNAPSNPEHTEPFNTVNRFERQMTLTVHDFEIMWPYFDVTKYPDPVEVTNDREIYSDVVGTADDTGVHLPAKPPTKPIERVVVWGWDRIDAIQVDYPEGGGPDGKTSTGRMGNSKGGSDQPPSGGRFEIDSTTPIVKVVAKTGDILNAMWLHFENGQTSNKLGGRYPGGSDSNWEYTEEILSSIKVMGVSRYYGSANAAVFGFKLENEGRPTLHRHALRALFLGDPSRPSLVDFVERLSLEEPERQRLVDWVTGYGWEEQRQVTWRRLETRVKAQS